MDLEPIWKRARADLTIPMPQGGLDVFLWEHTVRVVRNAEYISRLPEVQKQQPDEIAVLAAALYHEAGWIVRLRGGEIERHEMLIGPAPDSTSAGSAGVLEAALEGLIPRDSLGRASAAVHARNDRHTEQIEAQIVAEADNLEEFGPMFLWSSIRRGVLEGKGVQSVLDTWHRRKEYQFWTARLTDSFRFDSTRHLAAERLERLEEFMADLHFQQESEDVRSSLHPGSKDPIVGFSSRIPVDSRTPQCGDSG